MFEQASEERCMSTGITVSTIHVSQCGGECGRVENFPIFSLLSAVRCIFFTKGTVGKIFTFGKMGKLEL